MPALASEACHYYRQDGTPCYTVVSKNGLERPTTLRDARKLGLVPSVTTITKLLEKPALANWIQEQSIMAALTLPRHDGETDTEFIARIKEDSKEKAKKAAERGTALHADIERFIQQMDHGHKEHVQAMTDAMSVHGLALYTGDAEHSFAHPDGFGGKVDWHRSVSQVVVDFKSKPIIEDGKKYAWPEHKMQLGAYAYGLGYDNPRCLNIFIGIEDCKVVVHEWSAEEIADGLECFKLLLQLWRRIKGV